MIRRSLLLLILSIGCALFVPGPSIEAADRVQPLIADQTVKARMADVPRLKGTQPLQLRVIWTTDPATSATIAWSTAALDGPMRVHYDTQPRNGDLDAYRHRQVAELSGPYSDSGGRAHYHHASLVDLEPATTYYFVVFSGDAISREYHFVTAPAGDEPISIIYGGDSRTDPLERSRVNLTIARMAEQDPSILAILHGGDYIESGKRWDQWRRWLRQHTLTITKSGRVLPIIPTRGNHDHGPLFDEIFAQPGDKRPNYFVTQLGSEVAIVTLNTEISTAGQQRDWLDEQLDQLRPEKRWVLASYHRPAYPAVKSSPSGARQHWVDLFESHAIDLVLEADGHCIKRTLPILDDKHHPAGIVYMGEGGFGVPQRSPRDRWFLESPGFATSGHHVMRIDFTKDALRVRTILTNGKVIDDYTRKPRESVAGR